MARGVLNDRFTGYGIVDPGAGANRGKKKSVIEKRTADNPGLPPGVPNTPLNRNRQAQINQRSEENKRLRIRKTERKLFGD